MWLFQLRRAARHVKYIKPADPQFPYFFSFSTMRFSPEDLFSPEDSNIWHFLAFAILLFIISLPPHRPRSIIAALVVARGIKKSSIPHVLTVYCFLPFMYYWPLRLVFSVFWASDVVLSGFTKGTLVLVFLAVVEFPLKEVKEFLLKATLSHMTPAFVNCYRTGSIRLEDLKDDFTFSSEKAAKTLEKTFRQNLIKALFLSFYRTLLSTYALQGLRYALEFLKPYILRKIIETVDSGLDPKHGVLLSLALYIDFLLITHLGAQEAFKGSQLGYEISAGLESLIFKKAQRLSRKSREQYPSGKINTLITTDIGKITLIVKRSGEFVTAPAQLLFCMFSLWKLVGNAMLGGLVIIGLFIPLNTFILSIVAKYVKALRALKDQLSQAVSDLFSSMKLLKLYTWETVLMEKLLQIKEKIEIPIQRSKMTWNRVANFFWLLQPFLVSFTTLSWYTYYYQKPLTADVIFPAITLLNVLLTPVTKIPQLMTHVLNATVSLKKVMSFLDSEELINEKRTDKSDNAIHIHGSFFWDEKPALHDVNFSVKKGEFVALVGRVGSGKTAFLSAILGELDGEPPIVNGSVAYVSQIPWILNGSLRENILFGLKYEEETYKAVIFACQLNTDIEKFPDGDLTIVGEKGVSLSGGQKARVSLARALYSAADIYILDDVLSAVDNHVGQKLILEVFSKSGILSLKTVILATNNLPVLSQTNHIYLLEDGYLVENSSYDEIWNTSNLPKLREHVQVKQAQEYPSTTTAPIVKQAPDFHYVPFEQHFLTYKGKLHEETAKGKVLWDIYAAYFKSCSTPVVILVVALTFITSLLKIATDLWLKKWGDNHNYPLFYITGYAIIGMSDQLVGLLRGWLLICALGFNGAASIFRDMTWGLVHTSVRFFDKTPRGRITSRYSVDIPHIETSIPKMIFQVTRHFTSAGLSLSVLVYSSPVVIPVLLVLSFAYWHLKLVYLVAHREFKRLSGVTKAPLLSLLQENLEGADLIRAYGQEERFLQICYADNDFEKRVLTLNSYVDKWLGLRLQFLTSTIIFIASSYLLWKGTSGGMVGFTLSYVFSISSSLRGLIGISSRLDGEFVTVERCLEYANLEPEGTKNGLQAEWKGGSIHFNNYSGQYDPGAPVLQNISFSIKSGEKVGIVGRTGAGKSSLVLALFRMLQRTEGEISIQGTDIEKLDLTSLRRNLAIIPQDSFLFLGTIRENIDPLKEYLDGRIIEVLKDVGLEKTITDLSSKVSESGSNFSAGQKQLLCLARAFLKDSKILVLDEATASVDTQTDKLVHDILRKKAKEKTVITIAHRTDTVLESDKILGLENGRVVEFDTPENLLKRDSLFHRLIQANT